MTYEPAAAAEPQLISLSVNGSVRELAVEPRRSLADVLRRDLGLTGTNIGCEHGICGACTVLLDGVPVRGCLVFAVQADEQTVETVEGLADERELSRLQSAFAEEHALQCGFCTPGILMLLTAWLGAEEAPSDEEIKDVLSSNLCRCTGYEPIVRAVRRYLDQRSGAAEGAGA